MLDINVLLDYYLARQPFVADARQIMRLGDAQSFDAYIAATTTTHIYYFARKYKDDKEARKVIIRLLSTMQVATLNLRTLSFALTLPLTDYEDAVQVACAMAYRVDAIVTRDANDFKNSPIPVYAPSDFLTLFPQS